MLNLLLQYERKQRRILLFNYTEDFKCANEDLYLYEVVGTHEIPNSNKKVTERKNIQPQISIGSFDILRYLENTP